MAKIPSTKALRAFETTARLGSLKAAADALGVSASALGRRIQTLEEELGQVLFERSVRGMELTAAGRTFADSLAAIFQSLADATERVRAGGQTRTVLRMLAPSSSSWLLMQRIKHFQEKHPGVQVVLDSFMGIPGSDPRIDEVDIVIFYGDGRYPDWDATQLTPGGFSMPACSLQLIPDAPLLDAEALAQYTWIRPRGAPYTWDYWCAAAGVPGLQPKRYFDVADAVTGHGAAQNGMGLWMIGGDVANGSQLPFFRSSLVLAHPFHAFLFNIGYYVCTRPAARGDVLIHDLRNWIIGQYRNLRDVR